MKEAIEMLQQLQEQFFDGGVNGPNKDNWSLLFYSSYFQCTSFTDFFFRI